MSVTAMAWAFRQTIDATAKFVLVALADHASEDGDCWVGIGKLCEKTSLSDRAVHHACDRLVCAGLIEKSARFKGGQQKTNDWRVLFDTPNDVRPHPERRSPPPRTTFAQNHQGNQQGNRVPNGTLKPAPRAPNVDDPFGLDIPRIKEETFHLADQLARKAGITPLNHKPTKRAQIVQNALEALKAGRFLMWAQIHKPWILETGLPVDELPPVEDPIAFLSKALEAHNAAVNVGSRLTADNLADFFITKSADGWTYSPMWRFLHQGFQTTSPVSTILRAEILARPDGEATLKAIDRRRTNDGNQNPPTEPCVLRRARALLVWLAEKRPILDTHYTAVRPREYTNEKAFLQSIFQWMDEVGQQDGSSWIPDVNEPVSMARFTHWFHERYAINLNIKEPRKETPKPQATKSVTHKALWEQGEKPL